MPRLWEDTIEAHRRQVRDTILDTTASLVAEQGLLAVTMSQIAAEAGIGRATLYKYFSGVEEILRAWHDRQVASHLDQLAEIRDGDEGEPEARLGALIEAYARIRQVRGRHHQQTPHGAELAALLHRHDQLAPAQQRLRDVFRDALADAAEAKAVRDDVPPDELATYCLHALEAAGRLPTDQAVRHLVAVVMQGLRPAT